MAVVLMVSRQLGHLCFDHHPCFFGWLGRLIRGAFVLVVESVFEVGCLQDLSGSGLLVRGVLQALLLGMLGLEELAMRSLLFLIVIYDVPFLANIIVHLRVVAEDSIAHQLPLLLATLEAKEPRLFALVLGGRWQSC